jgi:hypothetical protein
MKNYMQRQSWWGDLKVALVFLTIAAAGALLVLKSFPNTLAIAP